jgi:hypothetical protein
MSRPRRRPKPQPVWWSTADESELAVLVYALVRDWADFHKPRCHACQAQGARCPHLAEAIEAVLDWLEWRRVRSKAAWLRRREDAA